MSAEKSSSNSSHFVSQLLNAGISAEDDDEVRLNKSLLMLATGLFTITAMLWPLIYSALGKSFSTTLPLLFQMVLTGNMLLYIKNRNFDFFRVTQLGIFLFLPFITQWAMGNFISSSGIILWALIAPIGALLCIGAHQSIGWFIAWIALTAISGAADYYLADPIFSAKNDIVPIRTSLVFFAINFIAVAASIYLLLRYSILEKRKMQKKLEETYVQLLVQQDRAESLLLNILPAPIAHRLQNTNQTIADGFADVTVMFADIVNFTHLAASLSPNQVFTTLNQIFSAFDELAEKYGLEIGRAHV